MFLYLAEEGERPADKLPLDIARLLAGGVAERRQALVHVHELTVALLVAVDAPAGLCQKRKFSVEQTNYTMRAKINIRGAHWFSM